MVFFDISKLVISHTTNRGVGKGVSGVVVACLGPSCPTWSLQARDCLVLKPQSHSCSRSPPHTHTHTPSLSFVSVLPLWYFWQLLGKDSDSVRLLSTAHNLSLSLIGRNRLDGSASLIKIICSFLCWGWKVEQTERSSVFMLTIRRLHYVLQQSWVIIYPLILSFFFPLLFARWVCLSWYFQLCKQPKRRSWTSLNRVLAHFLSSAQ